MIELSSPVTPVERRPLLSLGTPEPQVPHEFASVQGAKLHLALGEDSPGLSQSGTAVHIGQTDQYKKLIAQRQSIEAQQRRNEVAQSLLQSGALDDTTLEVVRGLSSVELSSPDISDIIEKKYANLYTNTSAAALENDVLDEATEADPAGVHDVLDAVEFASYKNSFLQTSLAQLIKEDEVRSFGAKAWDFGERMIPFVEWHQKQNAVGGDLISGFLPGTNLEEQFAYLWSLEPEEFKTQYSAALEEMKGRNLSVAISWAQGVMSYGSTDTVFDNLFGVADLSTFLPIKTLAKAGRALVKGSLKSPTKIPEIATEIGRYGDASEARVFQDVKEGNFFNQNIRRIDELEATIPSITSPNKLISGGINLPQEAINRLKNALAERSAKAQEFINDPLLIDRLTPEEFRLSVDEVRTNFEKHYPSVQKNVIGVEALPSDAGNVYSAKVVLGRRDGTLFESEASAKNFAARYLAPAGDRGGALRTTDYEVTQVGSGFQIEIVKNIDESRFLTDLKIPLGKDQITPDVSMKWLRSPDYTLSKQNVQARGTVVHTAERLAGIIDTYAKPIRDLPQKEFEEVNDLMVINREKQEYYETLWDFQQAFFDRFKKNPTEVQHNAYSSYVQMNDLDLVTRDLDWYKQKARLGLESITIKTEASPLTFEGKLLESLPEAVEFRFVEIDNGKVGKVKSSRFISLEERKAINQKITDGWKLVSAADQALRVTDGKRGVTGLVLTREVKHERVGVKNVDRKAGGHKVHEYSDYIKQPKLSGAGDDRYYQGDVTLFGARNSAEAKEVTELFNTARLKLKNGDKDAMKFIRDNLPISPKDFMSAVKRGAFDLDTEFVATRKGNRTIDTRNIPGVIDSQRSPLNLSSRITGRYGGERNLADVDVIKSEGDSVFETAAAPYLSPIDTLRISTKDMLNVKVLNDYSVMTSQNFIREFGDILDGSLSELQVSPQSALMNPKFLKGADPRKISQAKGVSRAYNNLMNYGTELDRRVTAYKEDILKGISNRLGEKGANWVDERMVPYVRNPGVYLRSMAFHTKMGFFNVKQYFTQLNTLVNVVSIGGQNGLRGGLVAPLARYALHTTEPGNIRALGNVAERVGLMKADEFVESVSLFKKSGFSAVGKDVAYLDDLAGPEIRQRRVGKGIKKALDWGITPFIEGERAVRMAAWNTAYLEKRAVKKGTLDRRDVGEILQRAKDLSGNMTRDSNAAWQKGYASVFTQFFGYQARIMEQMIGKKLTRTEKARLFAGFTAMYGGLTAVGATTGFIPVREIVTQMLSDQGVDVDDTLVEPFVDGFASSMIEFATGSDLSVADRWGPNGISTIYDLFTGDKPFADVFLGASGAIGIDTIASALPILNPMHSEWGDFENGIYNLREEDWLKFFRNISTVNDLSSLYQVYAFGVWSSRNGRDITKMDLPEAVTAVLTGLQPERVNDAFDQAKSTREFNEWQTSEINEISTEIRNYMRMDPGPEREYLTRQAKVRMDAAHLSLSQKNRVWRQALDSESMDEKVFERYEKMLQTKNR